jgi:hypothetical protein
MLKIIELEIDPELSGDTGVFEVAWVELPAIEQDFVYFSQEKFFKAPEYVSEYACRAIRENEKRGNPAGTQVGKVRAQQLCKREDITLETVKRMKSYLERAEVYNSGNWDDNGTISYGLWGGPDALKWVDKILRQQEDFQDEGLEDACWEGYIAIGMKPADDGSGRMVPNCVPEDSVGNFVYPEGGEGQDEFISRCMGDSQMNSEFPESDQRAAVCYSYWRRKDEFKVGVPHYTRDGELYEGPTHEHNGRLMTGEVHTDDSEYLYHEGEFSFSKVSFDWDTVLTNEEGRRFLRNEIQRGNDVYIVSSRNTAPKELQDLIRETGISPTKVHTVGTNVNKIERIKSLGIERHYDEDMNVRRQLGKVAVVFDYDVSGLPVYEVTSGSTMEVKPFLGSECGCEWDEEEKEIYEAFKTLKENHPEVYEQFADPFFKGLTEREIMGKTVFRNGQIFYKYAVKVPQNREPIRDWCEQREDKYFRRSLIDDLRDTNTEFGHNRSGYSKWLYKGGPQCVHAWLQVVYRFDLNQDGQRVNERLEEIGWASGNAGMACNELPGRCYYPGTPRYNASLSKEVSRSYMDEQEFTKCFGGFCEIDTTEQMFKVEKEQRMIYTPLMIPNMLIPRMGEDGERYFVRFRPQVIEQIQRKFMIEQRLRDTNLEHSDKKFNDVVMVESWIINGDSDKAYTVGFTPEQVPTGTWMAGYKILDTPEGDIIWNDYIKSGKVRGASVEGNFILNFSKMKDEEYLLDEIIKILNKISE